MQILPFHQNPVSNWDSGCKWIEMQANQTQPRSKTMPKVKRIQPTCAHIANGTIPFWKVKSKIFNNAHQTPVIHKTAFFSKWIVYLSFGTDRTATLQKQVNNLFMTRTVKIRKYKYFANSLQTRNMSHTVRRSAGGLIHLVFWLQYCHPGPEVGRKPGPFPTWQQLFKIWN